jgi:crotonobetainyl-CoA:carnitine CoA-transferase CaiB-like acyl-CoA transferase
MLASPGYFDGYAARHPGIAPRLGEHTEEVLAEAGLSPSAVARLAADGVVKVAEVQHD